MTTQVFISYNAAADTRVSHRLAADLKRAGLQVWIAPDSIAPGEGFPNAINRGLENSSHFLLLITRAGLGSFWVQWETDAAMAVAERTHLDILPLRFADLALPPLLAARQSISFMTSYSDGLGELLKYLGVAEPPRPSQPYAEDDVASAPAQPAADVDPFVEGALIDLRRTANIAHYLMTEIPLASKPDTLLEAVVETGSTSLRMGISIHPDPSLRVNDLLARLSHELVHNVFRVAGIFAIQAANESRMDPHRLNDGAAANVMHVRWNEADGREALAQGIAIFFDELRGRSRTSVDDS